MPRLKTAIAALILFLLPSLGHAQTITMNLTPQAVLAPATATFTVGITGGPCRSVWSVNGVGHYGNGALSTATTVSYTIPSTSPDYRTGTKVWATIYGCAGGPASILSGTATLTVNNLNLSLTVANDDGSIPAVVVTISALDLANNTTTAVLTLTTNAQGVATGGFAYNPANMYSVSFTLNGNPVIPPEQFSGALFSLIYPNAKTVTASFVLKAGVAALVSSDFKVQ